MNNQISVFELGKKFGYLSSMIERYIDIIGIEETKKLILFNETALSTTIRLNSLRSSYNSIIECLERKGVKLLPTEFSECKMVVNSSIPIGATPEYLNGYYMLQGKNSLFPSRILNPKSNEIIGDFAAAPGGKTSHMSELMDNKGVLVALEVSRNRCRSLQSNLSRMGVHNTIIFNMDSRNVNDLEMKFDRILLDAPCSGSGIIISDNKRKQSKTEKDLLNHHKLQLQLLISAIDSLKSGGTIVYCTCSLEPEENELVISKALKIRPIELKENSIYADPGLLNFREYEFDSSLSKASRLYPHKTKGEGFFIAKMVKV